MPNNDEAHRALDRVGIKEGPLPVRVLEACDIIEDFRMKIRTVETANVSNDVTEPMTEQQKAQYLYPHHHPDTALANYRSGREVYDTNGDMW